MSLQLVVPTLTNSIFRSEKEAFHAGNENFSALSGCSVHRDLSWCCIPLHSQKCNRAPCTILFRQQPAVTDYSVVDPKTCCGKSNVRCRGIFNSHSRQGRGKGERLLSGVKLVPRNGIATGADVLHIIGKGNFATYQSFPVDTTTHIMSMDLIGHCCWFNVWIWNQIHVM